MASLFNSLLICALLLFCFSGCGDIEGSGTVTTLTVSPSVKSVGISQSQSFTAIGKDASGLIVSVSPTWSVQGNIGSVSSTGFFSASSSEGSGYVVATYGTITGKATVTITNLGWISGRLDASDAGDVLGIKVYLNDLPDLNDFADTNGNYSIDSVPAGTHEVRTQETAIYQISSTEVTVASGETVTWNPILQVKASAPTIPTTTLPIF